MNLTILMLKRYKKSIIILKIFSISSIFSEENFVNTSYTSHKMTRKGQFSHRMTSSLFNNGSSSRNVGSRSLCYRYNKCVCVVV
jgi:hypothetical protein